MESELKSNEQHITILINNKPFKVEKEIMTGLELKQLAGGPLEYMLIQVVKNPDEVAGGDDIVVNDSDVVSLKSGMKFRIVNPATFG